VRQKSAEGVVSGVGIRDTRSKEEKRPVSLESMTTGEARTSPKGVEWNGQYDPNLMNDRRPKIQLHLAFPEEERSDTPRASGQGIESFAATRRSEHPASPEHFCSGRLNKRIAVYGPVRTVIWEGKSRKAFPCPDFRVHSLSEWPPLCTMGVRPAVPARTYCRVLH
jgi:hypothetical protein